MPINRNFNVLGVDDDELDGKRSYYVAFEAVASDDESYGGIFPQGVWVDNVDDDDGPFRNLGISHDVNQDEVVSPIDAADY
ncbi:MAG: hypothetical protein R3C99_27335 [Pirellulaceae bacterium]